MYDQMIYDICICFYISNVHIRYFFIIICRKEMCIQVLPCRTVPENKFALGFSVRAGTGTSAKLQRYLESNL